jgi:prepilin-type N-terminal cleavage/methylation domain-containing protein
MKKEGGYTLVELLIAIGISGLMFMVTGAVMFQLTTVSGNGNDRPTAIHEMQNAGYWFNQDGQAAVSATGGAALSLTIPSSPSLPAGQIITYSLAGTDLHDLQRSDGSSTINLAQHVTDLDFSIDNRLVTMDITCSISGRMDVNEQSIYSVYLRPVQP